MDIQNFLDLVKTRCNIRKFKSIPVPEEYVKEIIEAARWSPSGANTQPWEFIVVTNMETKRSIAKIFVEMNDNNRRIDRRFPFTKDLEVLERKFSEAPVLIAVCCDPRFMQAYPLTTHRDTILHISIGAAIEHIHLAASALGIASAWGTVGIGTEERLKELLEVPEHLRLLEVIPIGYAAEKPSRHPSRRNLESLIHTEKFDKSRLRSDDEIRRLLTERKTPDIYSGQ